MLVGKRAPGDTVPKLDSVEVACHPGDVRNPAFQLRGGELWGFRFAAHGVTGGVLAFAAAWSGFQPCTDIFGPVAHGGADLQVLGALPKQPPPAHGRYGQTGDMGNIEFIEKALQPFPSYASAFAQL